MMNIDIIYELEDSEKDWWGKKIKEFRARIVQSPRQYVETVLAKNNISANDIQNKADQVIKRIRTEAWNLYLEDECNFHNEVIKGLIESREMPRSILKQLIDSMFLKEVSTDKNEIVKILAEIVGDYSGRIMPYLYQLSLSTTNSRRSRAGQTFEQIIEKILEILEYPYDNQSDLGNSFYRDNHLGKMVDVIIPSKEEYEAKRSRCMMITAKTTLRERWQEVIEELQRTGLPHIYLLTLDSSLTSSVVTTLKQYNVTLVVYDEVKSSKFSKNENVQGFQSFFLKEIPHYLSYWKK